MASISKGTELQTLPLSGDTLPLAERQEAARPSMVDTIKKMASLRHEILKTYIQKIKRNTFIKMINPVFLIAYVFKAIFHVGCLILGVNRYALKIAQKKDDIDQIKRLIDYSNSEVSADTVNSVLQSGSKDKILPILEELAKRGSLKDKVSPDSTLHILKYEEENRELQKKILNILAEANCPLNTFKVITPIHKEEKKEYVSTQCEYTIITTDYTKQSLYRLGEEELNLPQDVLDILNKTGNPDPEIHQLRKIVTIERNSWMYEVWEASRNTEYLRFENGFWNRRKASELGFAEN